ncbi:MAG: patatin-like phospholipase family protein [Betaproteobacteria bacterium]|nr:patatin-like phospholipase family protein [Betaproteobacteria bacterium]
MSTRRAATCSTETELTAAGATSKAGLILTGGGARAAYQVGVLKAVRELLPMPEQNPFAILCGTSAGAINAATLAVNADNFDAAVSNLLEVWQNMHVRFIYRADPLSVAKTGARWLAAMMLFSRTSPVSLLDNAPLGEMLSRNLDFGRVQKNIDDACLYAVSITCSGYSSGQSVSFYQGGPGVEAWERSQRIGCAMPLRVEHLMASAALPFIFPAVRINREYFGDGTMRQIAPISPALHLGADRVLVISTGRQVSDPARVRANKYPTLAQIAGHAMNSIFLDSLHVDIERVERINRTIGMIPKDKLAKSGTALRPVKVLVISPSQAIERVATRYLRDLPWTIRFLLRGIGAMNRNGSNLASYLLFERGFCSALIDMGYGDTMARRAEVVAFFADQH